MKIIPCKETSLRLSRTMAADNLKKLLAMATVVLLMLLHISPAIAQNKGQGGSSSAAVLLQKLMDSAQGNISPESSHVTLTHDGFIRYLRATPGSYFSTSGAQDPDIRARSFLDQWEDLFQWVTPNAGYSTVKIKSEKERFYVRLQQLYTELPVFSAQIIIQLDATMNVTNVHSDIMRDFSPFDMGKVVLSPTISAEQARLFAVEQVVASGKQGTATEAELMIYSPSVVGNRGSAQLVWQTIVQGTSGTPLQEMVLVNAQTGDIALHYPLIHNALFREIYDSANTPADPGSLCRGEGDPVSPISDCNQAYDYFGDTYDFYFTEHGRDGYNNMGASLSATVRFCPYSPCPYNNAFWDTVQERMYFGEGYASADDVVAHELTHGVTTYESDLIYSYQSGAINESFSDVWGEFVDLTNSGGTDTSSVRWQMGEDVPGYGAIRDMSDPPAFGHPDRMGSPLYYHGPGDSGGVHINSGVNNKLCYLLTDGDSFNGHTITSMGIPRVADLYYECQINLLTPASDYYDLYNALNQAAINLGFSQAERDNIEEGSQAVEINIEVSDDSCDGYCGGPAPAGCWCDEACHDYGDCCADKCDFCPSPGCVDCQVTISPSSVNVFTWESEQFGSTVNGSVCYAPCYTWEISVQESTGSTINANGLYTAGGNPGTDFVRVTDTCNGNISDTATVIVDNSCVVDCTEDESGALNIVETNGTSGSDVTLKVEINSAPNMVDALGFEVTYNSENCLEYMDFEKGDLTEGFDYFECSDFAPGIVRCGGFDSGPDVISQGASGSVVKLTFDIFPDLDDKSKAVKADLQELVDDIAGWPTSPGYICGGCECDINDDEAVTPQDALCAFQKYLGICPTACGPCEDICGDVNGDDTTTPGDALCIFQEYLGIGCEYCSAPTTTTVITTTTTVSSECEPQSCGNYTLDCNPGNPDCGCVKTAEGDPSGSCVVNWTCDPALDCVSSSDCSPGEICAVDSCCGVGQCVLDNNCAPGVQAPQPPTGEGPTSFGR